MVRSQQIRRAAFVSVETHSSAAAVLDSVGRQLVPNYSVATFGDLEQAVLPVERALAEQSTLLVVDNMESILLPPFLEEEGRCSLREQSSLPAKGEQEAPSPATEQDALFAERKATLDAILRLCARLGAKGETRIVFTSREAIEQLVDAVHCHARTLALLAPTIRKRGVKATHESLVELMAQMGQRFPGSREQSVFASVELSLRRMSPANRERAQVLGVFHGGVQLDVLRVMMEWEEADVASLAAELIKTGLATPNRYNHLTLNPALCPYLRAQMHDADREAKRKAVACYLAYRRDGGENHYADGRICLAVTQSLLAGDAASAASLLEHLAADPETAWLGPFIQALQAIVAGSRDRALADAPELRYRMGAEILFLIETLEKGC